MKTPHHCQTLSALSCPGPLAPTPGQDAKAAREGGVQAEVGRAVQRDQTRGQRKQKENHRSLKGIGASKMKTRNKMLKMKAKAKGFSINLRQSKNTEVFVPIRIYTDPLTKVLWITQLASGPPARLLPAWHDDVRRAPLVTHDFFREGGKPLT